jgi:hypothetical protein
VSHAEQALAVRTKSIHGGCTNANVRCGHGGRSRLMLTRPQSTFRLT